MLIPSIVRVRGRLASKVTFAWLHVGDEWVCSTADPSFEVIASDGSRTRVKTDRDTAWAGRLTREYIGPGSELAEYDPSHPFGDRTDIELASAYESVELDEGMGIDVWGMPEYAAKAGTYRELQAGELVAVTAMRVDMHERADDALESRLLGWGLLVLAMAGAVGALLADVALVRPALLAAMAAARVLHRASSPLDPMRAITRPILRATLGVLFWGYVSIAYVLPGTGPFRIAAGALLALVAARWGVVALSQRRVATIEALLSADAAEGILYRDSVLTPTITLAPKDIATTWSTSPHGLQMAVVGVLATHDFAINADNHTLAVKTEND